MALEIERKFLVADDSWRVQATRIVPMVQGYLNDLTLAAGGTGGASVRVRIAGDAAFLNLKSRQPGRSRQEFDYPIPLADARELLALCVGGVVEKRRHHLVHAGMTWEIDEFDGANAGLVVAEIELDAPDQPFARPPWLGAEATDALRYYNLALAARPFAQWTDAQRRATDLEGTP